MAASTRWAQSPQLPATNRQQDPQLVSLATGGRGQLAHDDATVHLEVDQVVRSRDIDDDAVDLAVLQGGHGSGEFTAAEVTMRPTMRPKPGKRR